MVARPASRSDIQVEDDFIARLFLHRIEQSAQILLGRLGIHSQTIYLEHLDAVFPVKGQNGIRIFPPVREIILDTRIEPQPQFYSELSGPGHDRRKAGRIFQRIRLPVVGIVVNIPE